MPSEGAIDKRMGSGVAAAEPGKVGFATSFEGHCTVPLLGFRDSKGGEGRRMPVLDGEEHPRPARKASKPTLRTKVCRVR